MAARAFEPGQFYRLQNYRDAGTARRRHRARHGRASPSPARRSIARSGLLSTIVLEMGGSSDLVRAAEAGRAGDPDGSHGHADGNAGAGDGAAGRRRTRQRRAVFDRPAAARATDRARFTSPVIRRSIDRYKVEEIEQAADVVIWCCDEAPGFTPRRRAGQGLRRQHCRGDCSAYARGRCSGRGESISLHASRPRDGDRLRRHDGGGGARAAHGAGAVFEARSHGHRQHQFADAVHDERDLRAVSADFTKIRRRAKRPWCSPASIRTSRWISVDWANLRTRLSQNGVQEKLTKQWIDRCLRHLGVRPELVAG